MLRRFDRRLFGYGSLVWNPTVHSVERLATARGALDRSADDLFKI